MGRFGHQVRILIEGTPDELRLKGKMALRKAAATLAIHCPEVLELLKSEEEEEGLPRDVILRELHRRGSALREVLMEKMLEDVSEILDEEQDEEDASSKP